MFQNLGNELLPFLVRRMLLCINALAIIVQDRNDFAVLYHAHHILWSS